MLYSKLRRRHNLWRSHNEQISDGTGESQCDAVMKPAASQGRAPPNFRHSPCATNTTGSHGRCDINPYTQGLSRVVRRSHREVPQEPRVYRALIGVPGPLLYSRVSRKFYCFTSSVRMGRSTELVTISFVLACKLKRPEQAKPLSCELTHTWSSSISWSGDSTAMVHIYITNHDSPIFWEEAQRPKQS